MKVYVELLWIFCFGVLCGDAAMYGMQKEQRGPCFGNSPQLPRKSIIVPSLHTSAEQGDIREIKSFLKRIPADVCDKNGCTPLHFAALGCQLEAIKFLLAQGANVNAKDKDGVSVLQYAVRKGFYVAVEFFLTQKAFIEDKDNEGRTALHDAVDSLVSIDPESYQIMSLLCAFGANINA